MTAEDRKLIAEILWEQRRACLRNVQRVAASECARLARLVESWPVLPAVQCDGGTGPGVVVWVCGGPVEGVWW